MKYTEIKLSMCVLYFLPPGSREEPAVAGVWPTKRGLRPIRPCPYAGPGAAAVPGQAATDKTRGRSWWWEDERELNLHNPQNLIFLPTVCISAPANLAASENDAQLKSQCDQKMLVMQKDLDSQKDQVTRTQQELKVQKEQVNAVGFYLLTSNFSPAHSPSLKIPVSI